MSTSKNVIISIQAADYEPSEPAAMVAKSSFDTFSTPGRYIYDYAINFYANTIMSYIYLYKRNPPS
jgi:hypothetical protein